MLTIIKDNVALIRDEDNNTHEFFFGPKSLQNAKDKAKFPVFYLDAPLESEGEFRQSGLIDDVYDLGFFIGYNSKLSQNDYEALDEMVHKARYSVDRFVTKLSKDSRVYKVIGPVGKTDVYKLYDMNITGCFATVKVQPFKKTQKIC